MCSVDFAFARSVSAIAVTHNFVGSPHIDKQNTGPFYACSFGDFNEGTGGGKKEKLGGESRALFSRTCHKKNIYLQHVFLTPSSTVSVECSARVVGKVETKNRLGKIDGRYPHWVSPYDGERWSLVFYRTEEGNGQEVGPAIFNVDE